MGNFKEFIKIFMNNYLNSEYFLTVTLCFYNFSKVVYIFIRKYLTATVARKPLQSELFIVLFLK